MSVELVRRASEPVLVTFLLNDKGLHAEESDPICLYITSEVQITVNVEGGFTRENRWES